jgi:hypothetical protein
VVVVVVGGEEARQIQRVRRGSIGKKGDGLGRKELDAKCEGDGGLYCKGDFCYRSGSNTCHFPSSIPNVWNCWNTSLLL